MADLDKSVPARQLLVAAAGLRSDHGENPEYDRALVELIGTVLGDPERCGDDRDEVEAAIEQAAHAPASTLTDDEQRRLSRYVPGGNLGSTRRDNNTRALCVEVDRIVETKTNNIVRAVEALADDLEAPSPYDGHGMRAPVDPDALARRLRGLLRNHRP